MWSTRAAAAEQRGLEKFKKVVDIPAHLCYNNKCQKDIRKGNETMMLENVMVLDSETTNSVEQPLPYDVGYAIVSPDGSILVTRSFVVAEMFLDKELMSYAYFANKIPQYWEDIKKGTRELKTFYNIRRQIKEDLTNYSVKKVGAYNMGFDKRAMNNDTRYITKSFLRWFFPYGTEFFCIWNWACSTILSTENYINFALANGYVSDKGNIQTSAECAYRFLTNDVNFVECHTGLEDVLIEVAIMMACINSGVEGDTKINSACWRKVQKKKREMDLREAFK